MHLNKTSGVWNNIDTPVKMCDLFFYYYYVTCKNSIKILLAFVKYISNTKKKTNTILI